MAEKKKSALSALWRWRQKPWRPHWSTGGQRRFPVSLSIRGALGRPPAWAQSGVGKVNAAVCAQTMILKYAPSLVVNTGAAGGVGPEIRIGDLVVASACVQHDMDTTALGEKAGRDLRSGEGFGLNSPDRQAASVLAEAAKALYGHVHRGIVATGDLFVADPEKNREIGRLFSAKATEMEGGSIAQVCYRNGVPCAVLRAISDNADNSGKVNFLEFARMASKKCGSAAESYTGAFLEGARRFIRLPRSKPWQAFFL